MNHKLQNFIIYFSPILITINIDGGGLLAGRQSLLRPYRFLSYISFNKFKHEFKPTT